MESCFGMSTFYIGFCRYQLHQYGSYKPCEARLFKVKSEFFAEFGRFNNAKLVLYQPLLRKQINSDIQLEMARVEGFP